jgi:hypothetical protein
VRGGELQHHLEVTGRGDPITGGQARLGIRELDARQPMWLTDPFEDPDGLGLPAFRFLGTPEMA